MIVESKSNPDRKYLVYAVYWGEIRGEWTRHVYVIEPEDGLNGFTPMVEDEVDVVDGSLDSFLITKNTVAKRDVLVHKAAFPLDDVFCLLCDCGYPEVVDRLYRNLRRMGLEPFPC